MTIGCNERRLPRRGGLALGVLAVAVASSASEAHAYRTFADDPEVGYPARWHARSMAWELAAAGTATTGLTAVDIEASVRAAFAVGIDAPCRHSLPTVTLVGSDAGPPSPEDGRNTIAFLTDWSARGQPAGRGATTEIRLVRTPDGRAEIVEADILLNAEAFRFGLESAEGVLDLQSVIAHEYLHSLGFLHVCEADGAGGAPACEDDPSLMASALYPEYLGQTSRTPSADDLLGICEVYSPASLPCEPACASGATCMAGSCIAPPPAWCDDDADCARPGDVSLQCAVRGDDVDRCVSQGSLWTGCTNSSECESRLCLTSVMAMASYCTRGCASSADCPLDLVCAEASGPQVCRPQPPTSCAAARASTPRGPASSWVIGVVAFAVGSSVRRRRPSHGVKHDS